MVNIKELKEMIALMNENGLTEIEIEKDGTRVKLKKGLEGTFEKVTETVAPQASAAEIKPQPIEKKNIIEIKSPMVGTFYRAPSPDANPYVEIGTSIAPGQVVCIIEAMKLMNEIKSEIKGKIVDIPVENGHPVEFGQVLFVVEVA